MSCRLSPSARHTIVALLLAMGAVAPLAAQELASPRDRDEREEQPEPPPPLPEGLRGTVRPQDNASPVRPVGSIRDVYRAIQACWRKPTGSGYSGQEITLRLSFKRNGEVLGQPRITYYKEGTQSELREPFTRSVREAFERCAPLPFTESFGAAIAGRIFTFRFVDSQPM